MRDAVRSGILVAVALSASAAGAAAVATLHDGLHGQIEALTRELERGPDARLYLRRAELHRLHGAREEALVDLGRAEALAPELAGPSLCRARLELDAGRLESARDFVERHLARFPDDAAALLVRAELALQRGAIADAVRDYDRALLRLPADPDVHLARAEALVALGPGGVERALAGLDEALASLGPVAALELFAIELERARGRFDDALARLDDVAARSARQERWLVQRGEILREAGRPAEALAAYGAARVALDALPARLSSAATRALADEVACRLAELARALERE